MPKDIERKVKKTMRRKRARGEKIRDPGAYLYGTTTKIAKRRATKRRRTAARKAGPKRSAQKRGRR